MIVDDAVVVRGLFARWVEAEPDLEVVASLRTGREAVEPGRARRSRRGRARRRHAGARRHRRAAAAAGEEARPGRDHGLDADAAQRRDQLAGAVARRRRLYPEAGQQPRGHRLAELPPRADREDPPARPARRSVAARPAPRARAAARDAAVAPLRPKPRAGAAHAQPIALRPMPADAAARAGDRLLDRRPAGAQRASSARSAACSTARRC